MKRTRGAAPTGNEPRASGPDGPEQRSLFGEPPDESGPGEESAIEHRAGEAGDDAVAPPQEPRWISGESSPASAHDDRDTKTEEHAGPDRPSQTGSSSVGGPRRVFLGWDRPLLELATQWLVEEIGGSGFGFGFGLPGTTVVVPGRRAGRLLLHRLTTAARERGHGAILPPEILTVGALPERILEIGPTASEGTLRTAVAARLRQACSGPGTSDRFVAEALETALGGRPDGDDWSGWVEIAKRLEEVALRLESAGLPVERAARRVERMSGGVFAEPGGESDRWQAWREIDHWLAHELEAARIPSRSQRRFEALAAGRLHDLRDLPDRLILVGLSEVSPMVRELLASAFGDSGARADGGGVDCLIHGPRSERHRFDEYGCPLPEAWTLREGPLIEALGREGVSTGFVERPSDQIGEALDWVIAALDSSRRSETDEATQSSRPTVGIGDDLSAERVVQGLAARGIAGHAPETRRLDATQPGRCLVLVARYALHGGLENLLRCLAVPPIHRWVEEALGGLELPELGEGPSRDAPLRRALEDGDLITFVDRIGARGIAGRAPEQLDPAARRTLECMEAAVRILAAPEEVFELFDGDLARLVEAVVDPDVEVQVTPTVADLGSQARRLSNVLRRLVSVPIVEQEHGPSEVGGSVHGPAGVLDHDEWEQVAAALQDAESVERSAELRLDEVAQTLLEQPDRGADPAVDAEVEVVGWLELAFDPSPRIVVLDLNEGKVPSRPESDPLLPDSTLEALGGLGDANRLARDAFLLTGLLRSREAVRLLACRRDESGEPLLPSRLLLAGAGRELAKRVVAAYGPQTTGSKSEHGVEQRLWLDPVGLGSRERGAGEHGSEASCFVPVRPPVALEALDAYDRRLRRLRVTDFRLYLSCPYRFFLRRVLGAEPARAWPVELDAPSFGNFVHEALRRFGRGGAVDLKDADLVLDEIRKVSSALARTSFGFDPPLSVAIQLEHLDRRFETFARWQAAHRAAGWRTVTELTERDVSMELDVDGEPVEVVGRIDRVDRHPDHGYLLLDYKTGDRPVQAVAARAARSRVWNDLQLPLYREIARARRDLFDPGVPVQTGLVRVSKQVGALPLSIAPWQKKDYAEALDAARDIVRSMRRGAFWPPSPGPRYPDGFEWAAGDRLVGWKPVEPDSAEGAETEADRP